MKCKEVENALAPDLLDGIGREMAAVIAALRAEDGRADAGRAGPGGGQARRELLLAERLATLEASAAQQRARSLEGGLAQLLVLASLRGELELQAETTGAAAALAPLLRRMDGCLYSLAPLLAEAAGIEPAAAGADWYLNPRLDPHRVLERCG